MLVTWEALGSTFQAGLANGGPVSLIYGFILALFGTLALSASLAELASMWAQEGPILPLAAHADTSQTERP